MHLFGLQLFTVHYLTSLISSDVIPLEEVLPLEGHSQLFLISKGQGYLRVKVIQSGLF
jgi:hypothetical protein